MTDENMESWKCPRRKMLQADFTGRVGLKLIIRIGDFSHLQSLELIMILVILLGKIAFTFVSKIGIIMLLNS